MSEANLLATVIMVGLCVLCSAFFSASETALTAITRARIFKLEQEGNKRAKMVRSLRARSEALLATILLGNNVVNIGASALATSVAIKAWGEDGVYYVTGIMTVLVVVFGEVLPKTYAINQPEKVALSVAPAFNIMTRLFAPFNAVLQVITGIVLRIFGISLKGNPLVSAADSLRGAIELQHHEGHMVKGDKDMLGGILDLSDIHVGEIMIHRTNMETIDASLPPSDIIRLAIENGHSRLPLWKDEPDNIIGVLHIRDLLRTLYERGSAGVDHAVLFGILAKPWFVPETTSLRDQLHAFREQRQHFALVVDEYGALEGMLTLEDILEEIVGEIDDEHDEIDLQGLLPDGKGGYLIDGSLNIRDINRHLDWNLPDDHANTIAGLLIHEARQIPSQGEEFNFHDFHFTVMQRDGNQITRLLVSPKNEQDSDGVNDG